MYNVDSARKLTIWRQLAAIRALYKETCRFFACGIVRSILLDVTFFVTFFVTCNNFCNMFWWYYKYWTFTSTYYLTFYNADIYLAYYVALFITFFAMIKNTCTCKNYAAFIATINVGNRRYIKSHIYCSIYNPGWNPESRAH